MAAYSIEITLFLIVGVVEAFRRAIPLYVVVLGIAWIKLRGFNEFNLLPVTLLLNMHCDQIRGAR